MTLSAGGYAVFTLFTPSRDGILDEQQHQTSVESYFMKQDNRQRSFSFCRCCRGDSGTSLCFRWTCGAHRRSRGLWDITRPTPAHQTASEFVSDQLIQQTRRQSHRRVTQFFVVFLELGSPTPCALKIADKISEQCENSVLLMVRKTCVCVPPLRSNLV